MRLLGTMRTEALASDVQNPPGMVESHLDGFALLQCPTTTNHQPRQLTANRKRSMAFAQIAHPAACNTSFSTAILRHGSTRPSAHRRGRAPGNRLQSSPTQTPTRRTPGEMRHSNRNIGHCVRRGEALPGRRHPSTGQESGFVAGRIRLGIETPSHWLARALDTSSRIQRGAEPYWLW